MLKRIKIKNFKSFEDFSVDMPQFTSIVGNNGVGKSNLLRAISLISSLASGIQINHAFKQLDLINNEVFFDPGNQKFSLAVDLELHGQKIVYEFEIEAIQDQTKNFTYKVTKEILANGKEIINRQGDRISIRYDPTEQDLGAVDLVVNQIALSLLTRPKIVEDVRNFLSSMKVDIFEPSKLREPGSISRVLRGSNKNLAESLFYLKTSNSNTYGEIERESKGMIKGLENIDVEEVGGDIVISFKESTHQEKFTVYSSSDGNVRALGILVAILGDPKPSVIFIDEIENSMHPRRVKALMKFLNFLSEKEYEGVQIIFTTHSPVVLRCIDQRDIIYMFKEEGKTTISKPYENKEVHDYLSRALDDNTGTDIGALFETGALEDIYRIGIKKQ